MNDARAPRALDCEGRLEFSTPGGPLELVARGPRIDLNLKRLATARLLARIAPLARKGDRARTTRQAARALRHAGLTLDVVWRGRSLARIGAEAHPGWLGRFLGLPGVECLP